LEKSIKRHIGNGASWAWDYLVKRIFGDSRKVLLEKQKYLDARALASVKTGWFDVKDGKDVKETVKVCDAYSERLTFCDTQIDVLRKEMAAAMQTRGLKEFRITLPRGLDAYRVATVTSGIVNNIVFINPSDPVEFASCAALFEEYKMSGVTIHTNETLLCPSVGNQTLNNTQCVSVADPADGGTALTSVILGASFANKMFTCNGGTYATAGSENGAHRGMYSWDIHFPRGTQYDNSGQNMYAAQDEWLPYNTAVTVLPVYCYIKHYTVQAVVTATNVTSARMDYHLAFRSRQ